MLFVAFSQNLSGQETIADVAVGNEDFSTLVTALNGQVLTVVQKDGKILLKVSSGDFSEIVATDVMGSNGIIHVIDTVVMLK